MIALAFDNYGVKTASRFCSYYEVEFATHYNITIVPKMCKESWPPRAVNNDGVKVKLAGAAQNKFVFKQDLLFKHWSEKEWDADAACAAEIAPSLTALKPDVLEV
jgi:hypothetical protein